MPTLLALLALLASPAPVAQLSEAQLDGKIAQAHAAPFADRVDTLSKLFLGTPYGEGPLGEGSGIEPAPRWRTDSVDCQTFVETVLAMANSTSLEQAKLVLDDLRYAKAPLSFATRNHFTEAQWLPANIGKGYLQEATSELDPDAPKETLVLHRAQWSRVAGLQRLEPADIPEGKFSLRYLPLAEALQKAPRFTPGSVILVVREEDPARVVRVSHMGLVVRGEAGLVVRHAALGDDHRVIDEPLARFLQRQTEFKKWPVVGVALARPVEARARVVQVVKTAQAQAGKTKN